MTALKEPMLDSCLVKVLWHEERALNHKKDIQLCNSCRRSWEYLLDKGATKDFFADLFALDMDISGLLVFFSPFNPFGVALCNWLVVVVCWFFAFSLSTPFASSCSFFLENIMHIFSFPRSSLAV